MNENRRRLHPLYMLFALFNTVQGFLPFLLISLINGNDWTRLEWYWYAGVIGAVALLLLGGFMSWTKFSYAVERDRIVIRKGLLVRDEKTIYFGRIHSVGVEQPFLQRLLGIAQLKIETPGGSRKADGILPALSVREANLLMLRLRSGRNDSLTAAKAGSEGPFDTEKQAETYRRDKDGHPSASLRLSAPQLLMAAATSLNLGLVAAFVAGVVSFADDLLDVVLPEHYIENLLIDTVNQTPNWFVIAGIALAALAVAWLLSILLFLLKYSGFTISKTGERITVSFGLFEKRTHQFEAGKVQAVIVREGLLQQAIGYGRIQLQVVSSDKNELLMLHPLVRSEDVPRILAAYVPKLKLPERTERAKPPSQALLYYVRPEMLIMLAASAVLIGFFPAYGFWSLLLWPLLFVWKWRCYRDAGLTLEDGQLTLRYRRIARFTYLIRRPQIVAMKVKRTKRQERKELLSLSVYAMGSAWGQGVACLRRSDVLPVWHWFSRRKKLGK